MFTVIFAILLPFIGAAILLSLHSRISKRYVGWFVLTVPLLLFVLLLPYIPKVANGEVFLRTFEWIPSYGISFTTYLDGLSMILSLLITGIGTLVMLYSIHYLDHDEDLHRFYFYLLLFMGAMLGVIFSDNIFVLYVFWELTSISSFLLIAFWYHRKNSRLGAQKSLLITVSGGIAMLIGFIMLFIMTDSASIREIIESISANKDHHLFLPALLLIALGAFTKSAQFPLHIWLPDAMEAPTPVSAYLHSATMVKAGIYLVARFTPVFGGSAVWFWVISSVGLFTLFWGAFNAIRQVDLKALLAFSTVSQLGLIMSLFGLGSVAFYFGSSPEAIIYTQATFAALFHLINHSTFKGALFMVVGIIDHNTGTRDIRKLGGLLSLMPITFTVAVIGGFSMAGLPPFNGFLSKEMFFEAVLQIHELNIFSLHSLGIIFPVVAWIASIFTFVYSMMIVFKTFFGKYQPERLEYEAVEASKGMLIAPVILAIFVVGIFFFPNVVGTYLLRPAMASVYPNISQLDKMVPHISAWHGFKMPLFMTIGVVLVGIVLFKLLRQWRPVYRLFPISLSFNTLYELIFYRSEENGQKLTKSYMTGKLEDYMSYVYAVFILIVGGTFAYTGAFSFSLIHNASIAIYEIILVVIMAVAAIMILFAKSRLTGTLLNGVLGYSIAIFFVLFRAPDLALTQLIIETVTTALFLLCFRFLPEWKKEDRTRSKKFVHGIISIGVGAVVTLIALAVQSEQPFESISRYFEDAYELAGGMNIVNTILGDFRAFDTMLEVVVLFIAGLGVYTLVKLKGKKGGRDYEN